jgi:hypothetical protein
MQPFKHPACDCELPRTPPLSINQWDHLLLLLLLVFFKKKTSGITSYKPTTTRQRSGPDKINRKYGCSIAAPSRFISTAVQSLLQLQLQHSQKKKGELHSKCDEYLFQQDKIASQHWQQGSGSYN